MKIAEKTLLRFTTNVGHGDDEPMAVGTKAHHPSVQGFVEAKLELTVAWRPVRSAEDDAACDAARDAFLEGRFAAMTEILFSIGEVARLSITGTVGYVSTPTRARKEAFERNVSIFEDGDFPIEEANAQWGTNFRSARACAKHVIDSDGEFAGLEYHASIGVGRNERILITHSCGQIRDELNACFPDLRSLFRWHLNDMKAGAPDQMAAIEHERKTNPARDTWSKHQGIERLLTGLGILESKHDGMILVTGRGLIPAEGYIYGSGWVSMSLPVEALQAIHALCIPLSHLVVESSQVKGCKTRCVASKSADM